MNLIDTLGDTHAEHAVLTTYVFDPGFFSQYAIDSLHDAGVSSPVVMMDSEKYQNLVRDGISDRSMGDTYYLEPVLVDEVFHPKVGFFSGEDECGFLVGSANITLSEYTTAAQLAIHDTVEKDKSTAGSSSSKIKVAKDVRAFIKNLDDEYVTGEDASLQMDAAISNSEWVEDITSDSDSGSEARFLHNMRSPILDQAMDVVEEVVGDAVDVTKATMLAPFFGSKGSLSEIDESLSADEYDILVCEGDTYLEVDDAMESMDAISFKRLEHDTNRWIHAKALMLEGPWGSAILSGSPNMTGSALLSTPSDGNLEAAMLAVSASNSGGGVSSSLWHQDTFNVNVGDRMNPSTVETESYSLDDIGAGTEEETQQITLKDARSNDRSEEEGAEIILSAAGIDAGEEVRIVTVSNESESFVWKPDEDDGSASVSVPETFVHQPVRLETDDGKKSNYRQITTEPTPYTREKTEMLRSGGKEGIRSLADQALFENYSVASGAISQSVRILDEKEKQEQDEQIPVKQDNDDDNQTSWGGRSSRVTPTSRSMHLELKDGIEFSLSEVNRYVEEGVDGDEVEDLLSHLDNFYYLIHRSLVRTYLEGQIPEEMFDTELNTDKLHKISVSKLKEAHDNMRNILADVQEVLNEVVEQDKLKDESEIELQFKCFFVYPAAILNLMDWHDEVFIDRFRFTQDVYRAYCKAHPRFAEKLLDGELAKSISDGLHGEINDAISSFNDLVELDSSLSIPEDHNRGIKILMYTIWYRDFNIDSSDGVYYAPDKRGDHLRLHHPKTGDVQFNKVDEGEGDYVEKRTDRTVTEIIRESAYNTNSIRTMAELALDGMDIVRGNSDYEDLVSSGALDNTLTILEGTNPDGIIEELAEINSR
jgi:hypothetical protein